MSDISKFAVDGNEYNFKDSEARSSISAINSELSQVNDKLEVNYTDNETPFICRKNPVENSDRAYVRKLIGATVAENQLVQNGDFSDGTTGWKLYNTGTASAENNVCTWVTNSNTEAVIEQSNVFNSKENHVLFISVILKTTNPTDQVCLKACSPRVKKYCVSSTNWQTISTIEKPSSVGNEEIGLMDERASSSETNYIKNFYAIDLTLMFGTTIADYIYSLEQSTAGSGIAWLKSYGFLTKDYYGYSAGSLQSVKTSGKKTTGKNMLPPNFDCWSLANPYLYVKLPGQGNLKSTISFSDNDTSVNASGCYMGYVKNPYNAELEYHWVLQGGVVSSSSYTSSNGYIFIYPATEETFNKIFSRYKIQVEIGTTATSYEEYKTSITYPLGNDELRGVPKLVNNQLTYDGDIKTADGVITRRYGIVDLGTLNWVYDSSIFIANISRKKGNNFICSKYPTAEYRGVEKTIAPYNQVSASEDVFVTDSSYTDAATFKTAMSGVYLVYELATPTQETSSSFTEIQTVYDGGTEEFVDTRDVPVPVGHESDYVCLPDWLMDDEYFSDLRNGAENAIKETKFVDITADFDSGAFSENLDKYSTGNYIVKKYDGVTYAAVLAHYDYYYGENTSNPTTTSNINEHHWVAVVLGFEAGQMKDTATTNGGFVGSTMFNWLKNACKTAVKGAFGDNHVMSRNCFLTTGNYEPNAFSYENGTLKTENISGMNGFNRVWTSGIVAMLMTEEQIFGATCFDFKGLSTYDACRPLKLFQDKSYMEVLGRDFGQSNNIFNGNNTTGYSCWLRNISALSPAKSYCSASKYGTSGSDNATTNFGRFPIILLK